LFFKEKREKEIRKEKKVERKINLISVK